METTVARSIHGADLFSYIHPQKSKYAMDGYGWYGEILVYFKAASRLHISTIHPAGNGRIHGDHRE